MSENDHNPDPKIIVDEDWKSQVAQEKEQLKNSPEDASYAESGSTEEFPPASILGVISLFATQAMAAMGLLVDPSTGPTPANRQLAKHCIDTLGVLQEKTKGNLTEDESGHLRDALHQLRMAFVQTANQPDVSPEEDPPKPSSIELP